MVEQEEIRSAVRKHYSRLASLGRTATCCPPCECCGPTTTAMADAPPEASSLSAGCTSPLLYAELKEGVRVLDLGSGGGVDVFSASKLVGSKGQVIGVDSTPEMVWRARETARQYGYANVEFRLSEMEHLPLEADSVDVVMSNCAINLAPDKGAVFREAMRVLRTGGRLVVSDVVALGPIPDGLKTDLEAWSSCIAGAMQEDEYLSVIQQTGFVDVNILRKDPYSAWHSNKQVRLASVVVAAVKPQT